MDFNRAGRGQRGRFYAHRGSRPPRAANAHTHSEQRRKASTAEESGLYAWFRSIPNPEFALDGVRPLGIRRMTAFIQTACQLASSEDINIVQQIVRRLATEGGLSRLSELLEASDLDKQPYHTNQNFEDLYLPLLRIIADPRALASRGLERDLAIIYNYVYGTNGRRAVTNFAFFARALEQKLADLGNNADLETTYTWVTYILAALLKTMETCQTASINESLHPIVDIIQSFMDTANEKLQGSLVEQKASRAMLAIRRHLNYGINLPRLQTSVANKTIHGATFEFELDGPGRLSASTPRHDNDHEDIRDICILPTSQEISSDRAEYLPSTDAERWHRDGIAGLLDRQFRLLREDTIGQLRDCVRAVIEERRDESAQADNSQKRLRFNTYRDLLFDGFAFDKKHRLHAIASFNQPAAAQNRSSRVREQWWKDSRRLQHGALVCSVDSEENVLFFCVIERTEKPAKLGKPSNDDQEMEDEETPTPLKYLWSHEKRASTTLQLMDIKQQRYFSAFDRSERGFNNTRTLVEFPGVLLAAFKPTLEALQYMSKRQDVPFTDLLTCQASPIQSAPGARWPRYAQQPHFAFNLQAIMDNNAAVYVTPQTDDAPESIRSHSTLDDAQAKALLCGLTNELALIQGPPGTGKSFVAIQLIKILLRHLKAGRLGPIIIISYTNHALDQILENIYNSGITKIIRVGSRSKSELLEPLNLRNASQGIQFTKIEKHENWSLGKALERHGKSAARVLEKLRAPGSFQMILEYLENENPSHLSQLRTFTNEDGFQVVSHRSGTNLTRWLEGSPAGAGALSVDRPVEVLAGVPLLEMSNPERHLLYSHWVTEIRDGLLIELQENLAQLADTEHNLSALREETELRCLLQAQIIGITTSGLARKLGLLRKVGAKVMLCEEAGEILEAHALTAFLPSIEHAILIGDHEQLRPQIQNFDLSRESSQGRQYSLDVSIFERLITSSDSQIACETLQTQRRMDPSISDLIRQTIYPGLADHQSVLDQPKIAGMRKRLFWLEHQQSEVIRDGTVQTSRSNDFEVLMVESIIAHLVRQGVYKKEDIVVLTPYVRQLQKIRDALAKSMEIVVSDRDTDELEKQDLDKDVDVTSKNATITHKAMLSQAVRVATVDNFQGEEAKVVVVSLVRCNEDQKCGFLRTTNRINVLLSRAKHGMYIIGNSGTSCTVPMWAKVREMLQNTGNFGPHLPLRCSRHPDTAIEVSTPDDFLRLSPDGGCDLPCSMRLDVCGHACTYSCHTIARHNAVICQRPCERRHKECDHLCTKECGLECGDCTTIVRSISLPCGHLKDKLFCYLTRDLAKVKCDRKTEHTLSCGHMAKIRCGSDASQYICESKCGKVLPCGHACLHKCHQCRVVGQDGSVTYDHGQCIAKCGRVLNTCHHPCGATCHGTELCPLCSTKCDVRCIHSKCNRSCGESCVPCAERCTTGCIHNGFCDSACAVPCSILPCSKRCKELLACGHQCPSLCGEQCPRSEFCQVCASDVVKAMAVDYILFTSYGDINLDESPCIFPDCGHINSVESMDGWMSMSDHYSMGEGLEVRSLRTDGPEPLSVKVKGCPQCRGSLRNIVRYNRIVKRALLDESTLKFITWSNRIFVPLAQRLSAEEDFLNNQTSVFLTQHENIPRRQPGPTIIHGRRSDQMNTVRGLSGLEHRLGRLLEMRTQIVDFAQKVKETEQPYAKVESLAAEAARASGRPAPFKFDQDMFQSRTTLLSFEVSLRCDLNILSDILGIHQKHNQQDERDHPWLKADLRFDLTTNRRECLELAEMAEERNSPRIAIQALVLFARLVALERNRPQDSGIIPTLLEEARTQLGKAKATMDRYPSCAILSNDIQESERMIQEGTFFMPVTSEEMQYVYNAMQQDFTGTGHWYYCENRHLFSVGECGMPTQLSRCPECNAPVGGSNHQSTHGVTFARDLEENMGRMMIR